jgi:acetate kinase
MSERVGDIGVGAVLKLSEISGTDKLLDDFYKSSGLLALSVLSGDMRVLLAAEKKKHKRAHYAVESFIYHVVKQISSSVGVLGGINVLVFSGTIGERSHIIRHRICQRLKWLGIGLVGGSNVECMDCEIISSGAVKVMVYHSDEARVIAQRVIDFV